MFTLDLKKAGEGLAGAGGCSTEYAISPEDEKKGTFPVFLKLMNADKVDDLKMVSLEEIISLLPDAVAYSEYMNQDTGFFEHAKEVWQSVKSADVKKKRRML